MRSKRHIGVWTVWTAVYAFMLNAFLASFLLAATPTALLADDHSLCLTASHAADQGQGSDTDTAERVTTHCKQCFPGLAAAILPPIAPHAFRRIAITEPREAAFALRLRQFARFTQTSPRGPPAQT